MSPNGRTSTPDLTTSRKADHIRINLEEDVAAKGIESGFDDWHFVLRALPEIDLDHVDLQSRLLDHRVSAPLLVSCMTGGTEEARVINTRLATIAQQRGMAMGLGSCRVLLEHPDVLPTFDVRPFAPDIPLLANLGAVQLTRGVGAADCQRLIDLLRADILVLHLNPLQEALQPEGDTTFSGLLDHIETLCRTLRAPVIVKEVGWGIADDLVTSLFEAGVAAVDIAGAGGTSWSEVERHRMADPVRRRVAASFAGWGIPTTEALIRARTAAPSAFLIASGGVRSGIDVAKALALGADAVGIAGPLLRAAAEGEQSLAESVSIILEELRIAMFCTGAATVSELRSVARLLRKDGQFL